MMSKEDYLTLAAEKYERINSLTDKATMLAYEQGLHELVNELARDIISKQLGGKGADRRKKKSKDDLR